MWHNTEPDDQDSAGYADSLGNVVMAVAVGIVLGVMGVMLALSAGVRVPGLWG